MACGLTKKHALWIRPQKSRALEVKLQLVTEMPRTSTTLVFGLGAAAVQAALLQPPPIHIAVATRVARRTFDVGMSAHPVGCSCAGCAPRHPLSCTCGACAAHHANDCACPACAGEAHPTACTCSACAGR